MDTRQTTRLTRAEVQRALDLAQRKLGKGLYTPDMESVASLITDMAHALLAMDTAMETAERLLYDHLKGHIGVWSSTWMDALELVRAARLSR